MDLSAAMKAIRVAWSDEVVCRVAREFLAKCAWRLELAEGEKIFKVPPETELLVYSAAVIISEHDGFRDHIEAIVYSGVDRTESGIFPVHGVLRLYLDASGQMIT